MLYDPKWEEKINYVEPWRTILLRAADIVRERGLAKHRLEDDFGHVCIHGAIRIAACGHSNGSGGIGPKEIESCQALCDYLRQTGVENVYGYGAAEWNNEPGRTADEVIAALEGAARS